MAVQEDAEVGAEDMSASWPHADAQHARQPVPRLNEAIEFVEPIQQLAAAPVGGFPLCGQVQAARRAVEQQRAEVPLSSDTGNALLGAMNSPPGFRPSLMPLRAPA